MQDNELFELCKEVYKRTAWEGEGVWGKLPQDFGKDAQARIYTSDYLLEKISKSVAFLLKYVPREQVFNQGDPFFKAVHQQTGLLVEAEGHADPRIALLNFVIALDDTGVKL